MNLFHIFQVKRLCLALSKSKYQFRRFTSKKH